MYSTFVMENNFQSRLSALKDQQLDLLKCVRSPDALDMPLRGIRIAVHQVLCDMAGAELRDTGRISGNLRASIEKNRSRLVLAGAEPIAVEMEAAVIRQYGPEDV